MCCFDKTGTITGEDLVVEGVAGINQSDPKKLISVVDCPKETKITLGSAHALVLLEEGQVVGDPMERTTLDALEWKLNKGDQISPIDKDAKHKPQIHIRRRFQFSSALKRMSTVANVVDDSGRKYLASVKGAPETLKGMFKTVPDNYDDTFKYFTRRGSRVLALGWKVMNVESSHVCRSHWHKQMFQALTPLPFPVDQGYPS